MDRVRAGLEQGWRDGARQTEREKDVCIKTETKQGGKRLGDI